MQMGFEMRVIRNNPLTGEEDLDEALRAFLKQIGYIPEGYEDEAGFRIVRDCFLSYPSKPWTVEELLTVLNASTSTLYRYLNKLKGLDLLEEVVIPVDAEGKPSKKTRKGYKIRFESLSLAWSIVESHTRVAMENYRKSVDHIDDLVKKRLRGEEQSRVRGPQLAVDAVVSRKVDGKQEVLLIKRGRDPYRGTWALPGGFMEEGETGEEAVLRELYEETNLKGSVVSLLTSATDPRRDPRGHVVSLVYLVKAEKRMPQGGDDAETAQWHQLDSLPPMAFDHARILGLLRKR